ncbi:MAG: recombinase family protein [Bdellovibrionota bacterium]
MTIFGYARVSTIDQSSDFQITALKEAGAEKIFKEVVSGKSMARPKLEELLDKVQQGDTVLVWKLDRLGRSLLGVLEILDELVKRGIWVRSITEKVVDTTKDDHLSKAMLGILAVFGQLERDLIRERVREGVAIAKAQGKMKGRGRPKALGQLDLNSLLKDMKLGERTVVDLCKKYRISQKTYYNVMHRENKRESL